MTYEDMIQAIPQLSQEQRISLLHLLADSFAQAEKPYNVLDFAGVGEHLYDGVDAQDYVDLLRSEWDDRP